LSEGLHGVVLYVNDSVNNTNSTVLNFTTDTVIPAIAVEAPTSGGTYNSSNVSLNYTVSGYSACWYVLNGGSAVAVPGCQNTTFTGLHASNTVIVYVNDTARNTNSSSVTFTLDLVPPTITIQNPTEGLNISYNESISLNFTAIDVGSGINDSTCNYILDGGAPTAIAGCANTTFNVSSNVGGAHSIYITIKDLTNNTGRSSTMNFTIDKTAPTATQPLNATYLSNSTQYISWTLSDNYAPGYYYVLFNDTLQNSSTVWANNSAIRVLINTTNRGTWNYTLYFNDSVGNNGTRSEVFITIPTFGFNGGASDVHLSGVENLTIGSGAETVGGIPVWFLASGSPLLNFTHNFSISEINLTDITVNLTSSYMITNMSGQLLENETKVMYIDDAGFNELCIKDAEIGDMSEVSASCSGPFEFNFTACVGNSTGVTVGNATCYDEGTKFRFENLSHSGVRGSVVTHPPTQMTSSESDSKRMLDISKSFSCKNGTLEISAIYSASGVSDINLKLFNLNDYSYAARTTDSNGKAVFVISKSGKYEIDSESTNKFLSQVVGPFDLQLCSVTPPSGNQTVVPEVNISANMTVINETTNETINESVNIPVQTTKADALSAITYAGNLISNAVTDGKEVSAAKATLVDANNALNSGNYELAKNLALDASELAKNAKAATTPTGTTGTTVVPAKQNNDFLMLAFGALLVIIIAVAVYLLAHRKK
jgi:hypothetical protein